ncbi:MAG: hypothetical protein V7603_5898, partial [Micromonosporaceae bacterium]
LTAAGGVAGPLLGRPRRDGRGRATVTPAGRVVAAASGLALLAGSACTRFGIFYAGVASAEDPKYTVEPQRERLDRGK